MAIDPNKYYSIPELSKEFNLNRLTVRAQLEDQRENGVPYIQVGQQYRILGGDFLSNCGSQTYSPQPQQTPKMETGAISHT